MVRIRLTDPAPIADLVSTEKYDESTEDEECKRLRYISNSSTDRIQMFAEIGIQADLIEYMEDGSVDLDQIEKALGAKDVAAVVVQSPNFFGTIENTREISELARRYDALSIVNICEAVSLGILKPPSEADIVVGEAQALGIPMSFGGPHCGFLATRDRYIRQMPGRLVGMGNDYAGNRGFVLTLSTREQHIRREKATSNICTNQSLCALMATIYLATVGPAGLREICEQNIMKTDYAVQQIRSNPPSNSIFRRAIFKDTIGASLLVSADMRSFVYTGFCLTTAAAMYRFRTLFNPSAPRGAKRLRHS